MILKVIFGLNFRVGSLSKASSKLKQLSPISGIASSQQQHQQSRSITGKKFRDKSVKKPSPWPYKEKKYTYAHAFFINTTPYFDENTRVITIDGNIGCGKTELAKQLAEELEMKYFPEPSVDSLYIDYSGFDYRVLDPYLPKSMESCDLKRFYSNPHHHNVGYFQMNMFMLRLEQYCEALTHMLNTGDGIILERSSFSDFVFLEAMHKMGYVSNSLKNYYYEAKQEVMYELVKPHLVIYLDVPVDTLLKRIKQRKNDVEVNSKVLSKEYLQTIEHQYKQNFLKEMENHSELLVYDWSNFGDVEAVVEDLERINFDKYDQYDLKLRDWRDSTRWYWNNLRRKYANEKSAIMRKAILPKLDVPELIQDYHDYYDAQEILQEVPSYRYARGYNPLLGDKPPLFTEKHCNYWDLQKYRIF